MGKKRRQSKINNVPLPLLALIGGGIVLIVAAVLLILPKWGDQSAGDGTPAIAVEPEKIDYGDVKLNTPLTFKIDVTNTGDGLLRIEDQPYLEVVEGC